MPKAKSSTPEFIVNLDRLPQRERAFATLRKSFDAIAEYYGFEPITTSILEDPRVLIPLMRAGLFEERPLVFCRAHEGAEVFLRPSYALSILRAYLSHKMNDLPHPLKFFFAGESFFLNRRKGDRAATIKDAPADLIVGRPEWGLAMIGEEGPVAEAEIIQVMWKTLEAVKHDMSDIEIMVNATGCATCRTSFRSPFTSYFRNRTARLCRNCKKNLKRVPTRVLICEEEKCKIVSTNAPQVLDFLCEACKKHLRGFLEFLDEVRIPYFLNPKLFRDDSWFSSVLFEFSWRGKSGEGSEAVPPRLVIGEGGRLSRAGELMAGKRLDAVGASIFLDAAEKMFERMGSPLLHHDRRKVFLAHLGDLAKKKSLSLLEMLRAQEVEVQESLGRDSIKSQLKIAERVGAKVAIILGQKEALDNTIIVREMDSGIQETMPQEKLVEFLKRKLKI